MKTKVCFTCKEEKPLTSELWVKDARNKGGYRGRCRKCVNAYNNDWIKRNPQVQTDYYTSYYATNKIYISRRVGLNQRAKKYNVPGRVTLGSVRELLEKYPYCLCCGCANDLEVDHVIPLSKGGDNAPDNFQILCNVCNAAKGTDITDYRNQPKPSRRWYWIKLT